MNGPGIRARSALARALTLGALACLLLALTSATAHASHLQATCTVEFSAKATDADDPNFGIRLVGGVGTYEASAAGDLVCHTRLNGEQGAFVVRDVSMSGYYWFQSCQSFGAMNGYWNLGSVDVLMGPDSSEAHSAYTDLIISLLWGSPNTYIMLDGNTGRLFLPPDSNSAVDTNVHPSQGAPYEDWAWRDHFKDYDMAGTVTLEPPRVHEYKPPYHQNWELVNTGEFNNPIGNCMDYLRMKLVFTIGD